MGVDDEHSLGALSSAVQGYRARHSSAKQEKTMRHLLGLSIVALFCFSASAQLPTSTLNGTVTDPQGAAVATAKVTLISQATGITRETTSDTRGFYTFANVEPDDYTVRVESPTFAKAEIKDVHLEVGRASTVDAKLAVARAGEVVTVQVEEAQVDLTQSEVQGLVTANTIGNIPLNGRNFLELAFLIPGNRPATNFDPTKTNTLEVSSAGAFGRGGNITVDGGDNNDEVVGGTLMNFPQDSIQEFQIATNKFTSEVGRSGSSIINIITKSGTNNYHGGGFLFFRHKALQAKPALSRDLPAPHFVREQFGGQVGGPIKRDRAFWFFSTEYLRQDHAVPVGERDFATSSIVSTSAPAFVHDVRLTARTDFKLNEKDSVLVRYSFNRSRDIDNGSLREPLGAPANRQSSFNRFNSPLVNWTRVVSPRVVNSLIFHSDWFLNSIPAFSPDNPVTNPAGLAAGNEIRFPSLQDGANFRIPQSTKFNRYQVRDTLSWVVGNHTFRFGGEYQHLNTFALFDLFGSGSIFTTESFPTQDRNGDGVIDDRDIPIAVVVQSAAPTRPPIVPFYPNSYFGTYVQDDWKARSNLTLNLGLRWETDDVLGQASNLHPCSSLTTADNTCDFVENILGRHPGRDYKEFGPRVGFAWDPLKRGQTVFRGGYGIYYDRVVTEVPLLEALLNGRILPLAAFTGSTLNGSGNFAPDPTTGQIVSLSNPFGGGSAVFGVGINHIANNAKHPYVQQFTLGLQQQLGQSWILSADGLHDFGQRSILGRLLRSSTVSSPFLSCPNGFDPCTITDPLTGRSDQVTEVESVAESWYDALLVSLQKRPTGGPTFRWGFNVNYTFSKTFNFSNDDQIPFNGAEDQVNQVFRSNDLRLEKGYAPTDERHRFVFFGVFDVPWKLTVSPIWTYGSHVPMDSVVPGLSARLPILRRNALGRDISNGAQLNAAIDTWNSLPPCTGINQIPCFKGTPLAHVDPNLKFGDDFNSFDLRVTKRWVLPHEQNIQFVAEVFNFFNITNVRGFNNNNYSGFLNDITSPEFNKPLSTAGKFFGSGGQRAFQFALKYAF
ncbi:MAG: hypothetical protein DMG97_00855 [Acidobacteria bacterium]|nr:MAG: hypothetical protein DMG97_00855 [Acidobacteriota bacterium]